MIEYLNALIYGLVQGATEFLPVSSSGHLLVLHKLLPLSIKNELGFDAVLHLATLGAVIAFFYKEIVNLIFSWLKSLKGEKSESAKLAWLILLCVIPALLVGYFFSEQIDQFFRSLVYTVLMLVLVGIILIFADKKFFYNISDEKTLNWKKSLAIGLAQVLAFIPGTSRSGITIIAGLASGLKREAAVRFSFLISIPLIAAAGLSQISSFKNTNSDEIIVFLISFISAFVSGFFAIKFLLKFAERNSLKYFAYYRFLLAAIIIIYFFL